MPISAFATLATSATFAAFASVAIGATAMPLRGVQSAPPWSPESLQTVTLSPAAIKALEELDSRSFAVRQAASKELLNPAIRDGEIYVLLSRPQLTAEQHARLLCVAQLRILEAPRAALGIQMDAPARVPNGVIVSGILRGMPSEGILKPGDRITRINEQPIATRNDLMNIVQNMRPGDRVRLVVMRIAPNAPNSPDVTESRLEFELPLGSQRQVSTLSGGQVGARASDGSREHLAQQLLETFAKQPITLPVERTK